MNSEGDTVVLSTSLFGVSCSITSIYHQYEGVSYLWLEAHYQNAHRVSGEGGQAKQSGKKMVG